jgi:large subunit ribosomal protein L5
VSKEKQGAGGAAKGADEAPVKEGAAKGAAAAEKAPKAEKADKGQQAPKGEKGARGQKPSKGGDSGETKAKAKPVADPPGYKPRLKALYLETVAKDLRDEFSYKSSMQIPRLSKIIVSMGLGEAIVNKKLLDSATAEMSQITGRKPVRTKAKKSIATFKVRQGQEVGAMVTLRGNVMYEFLDRLVNVAMPRIKDFRGANPNAFDGHGNYSLGVTEQIIFPEIDYDKIERVSGMNIAVVTTATTDQEARSLLARLGMPFRK